MRSIKLDIPNRDGKVLSANLDLPDTGSPHTFGIFAHCFTCSKDFRATKEISKGLVDNGCGILRFDFTGLGHSEGDFADTNFASNISDLLDVNTYMTEHYEAPRVFIGHSLGGAAVIQATRLLENDQAVVTIGAPADPAHVTHLLKSKKSEIEEKGEAVVLLGGREFKIKKQFLDDLEEHKMEYAVQGNDAAILILHSPIDTTVGIENAQKLYHAAKHPKSFVSLDGADHLISKREDARYAARVISAWGSRYLAIEPKKEEREFLNDGSVLVRNAGPQYTTQVEAGGHQYLVDEPASIGGDDLGATPYEHLLSALGSCTAITLRMYAKRKEWDVGAIEVKLRHTKIHHEDCENCEEEHSKIYGIETDISFSKELSPEQLKRLDHIAHRCPVHRTLTGDIQIKTNLNASS